LKEVTFFYPRPRRSHAPAFGAEISPRKDLPETRNVKAYTPPLWHYSRSNVQHIVLETENKRNKPFNIQEKKRIKSG
ncbi:MAG: hypothetical protein N2A40_05920, partial [Desulfobulbaceae bacterium]